MAPALKGLPVWEGHKTRGDVTNRTNQDAFCATLGGKVLKAQGAPYPSAGLAVAVAENQGSQQAGKVWGFIMEEGRP